MRLPDRMVRVFSGHGAVSLRDHSVTGLQSLQFTPFEQPLWRFDLSFTDTATGCLIEDATDDIWSHHAGTGEGHHPLGLNFADHVDTGARGELSPRWTLVLQSCDWGPNSLSRVGTFHKRIDGKLLSFRVRSVTRVDARLDVVHIELEFLNRGAEVLDLDVRAYQRVSTGGSEAVPRKATRRIDVPVWQWPGEGLTVRAAFVRRCCRICPLPATVGA